MAKVKVTINHSNMSRINENAKKALLMTADATLTDILQAQVIPFDTGTMQNDQTFVDDADLHKGFVYIVTSAPQANRLYFHPEINFQTVNNPNAQAGWFEDWVKGNFCKKLFSRFYRELNGG